MHSKKILKNHKIACIWRNNNEKYSLVTANEGTTASKGVNLQSYFWKYVIINVSM